MESDLSIVIDLLRHVQFDSGDPDESEGFELCNGSTAGPAILMCTSASFTTDWVACGLELEYASCLNLGLNTFCNFMSYSSCCLISTCTCTLAKARFFKSRQ